MVDDEQSPSTPCDSSTSTTQADRITRFKRRWDEKNRTVAPRAGPDAYLQLKHERSLLRQREIERERSAFTARRRNMIDELDRIFNLSEDPRVHFMRLHERPRGNEACVSIVLRYAFAVHLDRVRAEKVRNRDLVANLAGAPPLLAQARAALARERPELSRVAEQTCFRHPSIPEGIVAHEEGVHIRTVGRRKWASLHWLRHWLEERRGVLPEEAG